jgi:hypothetical protein
MGECTQRGQRSQLHHVSSLQGALATRAPSTGTLQVHTCTVVHMQGQL